MKHPILKPYPKKDAVYEDLHAAIKHVDSAITNNSIALGAAYGIVYSIIEMLGIMVGTPSLPEQMRIGYEGLIEAANELEAKIDRFNESP